ncbi:hypothetical protein O181_126431 [Austropuccinia psidii MF-1]|uniref:Uncharacterized protein n=1 Tax=Austropuccinia psidii MF-1 TaxID=1389203 RepID=A0A9Q3Q5W9_9BASI|nr:hypothetical protein [Austropuccinia psidii MF-1]
MRKELINLLYTYRNSFSSSNEPLCSTRWHEADINLDIYNTNPVVLKRPAYPEIPRAIEALEKCIQKLKQLCVLIKLGHNKEVEVTTPVIIAWNNDKSRMVGDFRVLNTDTVSDRYPIPRIKEALAQLALAQYTTSMDS